MPALPLIEKHRCRIRDLVTVEGTTLPDFDLGYECYGTLNAERDNVILICHYFSGDSHAAGRYTEEDPLPGWWDSIIGPEKAIDTNRFFVICSDTLVNQNKHAIASGPASLDPSTNQPYGMRFPTITMRDFVNAQRQLLRSLNIEQIYAVAGPSMGSMQALTWAAAYPNEVERVIAVIPAGLSADAYLIERTQQWADSIQLDPAWNNGDYYNEGNAPTTGLSHAVRQIILSALHPDTLHPIYGRRKHENGRYAILEGFKKNAHAVAALSDANAILYLVEANQRYDLLEDPVQGDARLISAPMLFITAESDLLLFPERAQSTAEWLRRQGKHVQYFEIEGCGGHLDGVSNIVEAEDAIRAFLL